MNAGKCSLLVMHSRRVLSLILSSLALATAGGAASPSPAGQRTAAADSVLAIPDSLRGRSGQLRVAIVLPRPDSAGGRAAAATSAAVWSTADTSTRSLFHFISLLPFSQKQGNRVGAFSVGQWPAERRAPLSPAYRVPDGFIEMTPELQSLAISTHFVLGDFLSVRSQHDVWPKPLVLNLRLVDKLELIIQALADSGFVAPRLTLMSAFRTPSVTVANARTARAPESRHQYGDAADIIVDADGDGRMDDLNADGRVDLADARYLVRIILAVEEAHPELVGGIGVYRSAGQSGPFVHVDARGERARWGLQ